MVDALLDERLFNQDKFEKALTNNPDKPVPIFRSTLKAVHNELTARFDAGRSATELVYMHAQVIDKLLVYAWSLYFDIADRNIALIAVGGYGRGELHPHSDIDLLILLRKSASPYKGAIIAFTTFLWDIGLEVGHSVRNPKECVREARYDITVATNLQESRLLTGPSDIFDAQKYKCGPKNIWPSNKFFAAKLKEQKARHLKFNDTAYNLEPNIKEGPGGLRDIQMIGWVAKRHFNVETLSDLVSQHFLTRDEYKSLHEGQAFLWQIRYGLHIIAKRREDRLLFDHQRTLAKKLGYQDDAKSLGVEKFMKQYYRTVMELNRLNEILLQVFDEEILAKRKPAKPAPINNRFQARKDYLEIKNENTFTRYPFALLEVFLLMAQHMELKGVSAKTIRAIRSHKYLIDARFRDDLRCKALFMEILKQPHGVTHELRRMNRYGVLAAYLPVFENIVGQMQHDLFHLYTVDEHTMRVVRNLRRFTVPEFYNEFPLCSQRVQKIPKLELLILGGFFHDIAKGRGGDHSTLGAKDAAAFCKKHGLSQYDGNLVAWLVKNHLMMSATAQRKDISDPDVVHEFACRVGNQHRLDYLYLLTVADMRATSPDVWNSWKDSLLKELYFSTKQAIRRGLHDPILQSENILNTKMTALDSIQKLGIEPTKASALWQRFEDDYFLRYSPQTICWHTAAILGTLEKDLPLILMRHADQSGGTEIFIYHHEHDRTFSLVTSTLERLGLSIADARILSSKDGYILDTYMALDESGESVTDQLRLQEVTKRLTEYLKNPDQELPRPAQHISRQTKAFRVEPDIQFWEDEKNHRTAVQVITNDRPGLLSRIANAFLDCRVKLQNAKIATFGALAEDIFYITDENNEPVSSEKRRRKIIAALNHNLLG